MMQIVNCLLFLIFPISIISGLFVAPWMCFVVALVLWQFRNDIKPEDFSLSKLEILLVFYVIISSFWAPDLKTSIGLSVQLILVLAMMKLLIKKPIEIKYNYLAIGMVVGVIVFLVEYFTWGAIISSIRSLTNKGWPFDLSWTNRGCSLIAVILWPVIYMLYRRGKKIHAGFLYAIILGALFVSDSAATQLAFLVTSIGFLLLYISKMKLIWLVKAVMIIYMVVMPVFSKIENPRQIAAEYGHIIPISHIHRLLIWNFVADKVRIHPLFGYGMGASKFIEVNEEDKFLYKGHLQHPLPLHPHNNVMQLLLELGVFGLCIFGFYAIYVLNQIKQSDKDLFWQVSACSTFICYFVIGMTAYGMWQSWWMMTGVLAVMLMSSYSAPVFLGAAKGRSRGPHED